jgi:hypothetical protein
MTAAQTDDWRLDHLLATCESLLDLADQARDGPARTRATARRQLDRAIHDLAGALATLQAFITPAEKPDASVRIMTHCEDC